MIKLEINLSLKAAGEKTLTKQINQQGINFNSQKTHVKLVSINFSQKEANLI